MFNLPVVARKEEMSAPETTEPVTNVTLGQLDVGVRRNVNVNVLYSMLYIPLKQSRFKSGTQTNTDKVSFCAYLVEVWLWE